MQAVEEIRKKLDDPMVSLFEKIEIINKMEQNLGAQSMDVLRSLVYHSDTYLRREAVLALGNIHDRSLVQDLVPLTGDSDLEVRKSAVIALGKIGGSAALEAIERALNDESWIVRYFAERSLNELKESPPDPVQPPTSSPAPSAPPRLSEPTVPSPVPLPASVAPPAKEHPFSIETYMERLIEGTGIRQEKSPHGFLLTVPLEGGRKQRIYVTFKEDERDKSELIVLYTTCGAASPPLYKWALTANAKMTYGGIALRQVEGKEFFTMSYSSVISYDTIGATRKVILDLAAKGDWIEKNLTRGQEDRF
ncbi:MAG: HEAT repeat domain-containing protein [Candidatus Eremiobacteraeota bacterium]|nr:HEAT repeat domain-containing protein [Candidatus Eremiobacteraeota bacterium]